MFNKFAASTPYSCAVFRRMFLIVLQNHGVFRRMFTGCSLQYSGACISNKCVAVAVTAHIIKCVASSPEACSIPAHEAFLKKYGQVQSNVTNYEIYGLMNILWFGSWGSIHCFVGNSTITSPPPPKDVL